MPIVSHFIDIHAPEDFLIQPGETNDKDTVNTIFDEDEYINASSGLYRDNWFD